jgi:hypothetical protein
VRTRDFLDRGWGADYHINGNSLYKMGDPCFERFLRRVQTTYPHKPFDMGVRFIIFIIHILTIEQSIQIGRKEIC